MRKEKYMKIDTASVFGKYEPSKTIKFLIKVGQLTPNFLGQQFAQIVRKYLIKSRSIPLDIEVEGLHFRFYLHKYHDRIIAVTVTRRTLIWKYGESLGRYL